MTAEKELVLYKIAVDNALAIFKGVVLGEYDDQKDELLYDAKLYIKGAELYKLGKINDN